MDIEPQQVTYFGRDEHVLPRDPTLLDRVSNLVLILCADALTGLFHSAMSEYARGKPRHRQYGGSQQLTQP